MIRIDLKALIEEKNLNATELARELFPGRAFPTLALNRVLKESLPLDEDQISKLSMLTGIPIPDLFLKNNWDVTSENGIHVLTNGDYKARINMNTGVTELYHKDSMFHDTVIHSTVISLSEYAMNLNTIINNHKIEKQ